MEKNIGKGRRPTNHTILFLAFSDNARPDELVALGYTKAAAYRYTAKAKKLRQDYYTARARLKELRATTHTDGT